MRFQKSNSILLLFLFSSLSIYGQQGAFGTLVDSKGKPVKEAKLLRKLEKAEVVFFGEEHDNQLAHYLTLQYLQAFRDSHPQSALAMEMFERDQQAVLDSVNKGWIELDSLAKHTRLWSNYSSDYAPLLQLAQKEKMPIVGSNIPRSYASYLYKNGREAFLAWPEFHAEFSSKRDFVLDTTLSQYAALKEMAKHMNNPNFVEAQAIKDATMARFVSEELAKGNAVFHVNGCYHSDFQQGILWYLKQERPTAKTLTISIVSLEKGEKWKKEWIGKADFIWLLPNDFPKSYE